MNLPLVAAYKCWREHWDFFSPGSQTRPGHQMWDNKKKKQTVNLKASKQNHRTYPTWAMPAAKRSGRWLSEAPTSRPPFEPPLITILRVNKITQKMKMNTLMKKRRSTRLNGGEQKINSSTPRCYMALFPYLYRQPELNKWCGHYHQVTFTYQNNSRYPFLTRSNLKAQAHYKNMIATRRTPTYGHQGNMLAAKLLDSPNYWIPQTITFSFTPLFFPSEFSEND